MAVRSVIDEAMRAEKNKAVFLDSGGIGPWGCKCRTFHHRMTGDGY